MPISPTMAAPISMPTVMAKESMFEVDAGIMPMSMLAPSLPWGWGIYNITSAWAVVREFVNIDWAQSGRNFTQLGSSLLQIGSNCDLIGSQIAPLGPEVEFGYFEIKIVYPTHIECYNSL